MRTEVQRSEVTNKSKRNNRALCDTSNMSCANFIMSIVKDKWFKELEDLDTFYTKVTTIQLLDHLKEHCSWLCAVDAVKILQIMQSFYKEAEGIPQFINMM